MTFFPKNTLSAIQRYVGGSRQIIPRAAFVSTLKIASKLRDDTFTQCYVEKIGSKADYNEADSWYQFLIEYARRWDIQP